MQVLGGILQEERLKSGLRQADLARRAHVSRQTLSGYETGAVPIPHDVACHLIHILQSARLQYQYCFSCPANLLTTPWLDVDAHPVVVQHKVKEELREALEALDKVQLTNKRSAADLNEEDKRNLGYALEQLWDCIPALQMLFGLVPEYGFSLEQQREAHYQKLRNKRYLGYQSSRAKVAMF